MAFEGYLLKSGGVEFPHQYIELGSWSTNPDQREEIKAYRDDNTRELTRVTASGKKSVIKFTTRPRLHLAEKQAIQSFFTSHETNQTERKIPLQFWNDETNDYDSGEFYRPNMEFKIIKITDNDIIYDSMQFELVEY